MTRSPNSADMATFDAFKYAAPPEGLASGDRLVVIVPKGVAGAEQLLAFLNERLKFPSYFGCNWNALSDCLRDLSWVKEPEIQLVHQDLPGLGSQYLTNYLDVLDECTRFWSLRGVASSLSFSQRRAAISWRRRPMARSELGTPTISTDGANDFVNTETASRLGTLLLALTFSC